MTEVLYINIHYLILTNVTKGEIMVLRSFNVNEEAYKVYSKRCKELGISMSKQIDNFIKAQVEDEPEPKKEYMERLETIRKQKTIHIGTAKDFKKRYGIE